MSIFDGKCMETEKREVLRDPWEMISRKSSPYYFCESLKHGQKWDLCVNGEVRFCLASLLGKVKLCLVAIFPSPEGKSWMSPSYSIFEKYGGRTAVRSLFTHPAAPFSDHSCRPGTIWGVGQEMGPASESAQGTSSLRLLKAISTSDPCLTESRGESQRALTPSFSAQSRQLAALWLC